MPINDTVTKELSTFVKVFQTNVGMNRIIIVGNGFDKAHGLKTGYDDFIDWYWTAFWDKVYSAYYDRCSMVQMLSEHEDIYVKLSITELYGNEKKDNDTYEYDEKKSVFENLKSLVDFYNSKFPYMRADLSFKNLFFEKICNKLNLINWVDIENEYYMELKSLTREPDPLTRSDKVKKLNMDFKAIKELLYKYLKYIYKDCKSIQSIENAFVSSIHLEDISLGNVQRYLKEVELDYADEIKKEEERGTFFDPNKCPNGMEIDDSSLKRMLESNKYKDKLPKPAHTLVLNFNYTYLAEECYVKNLAELEFKVINIHGELTHTENPIIFGYGDDLDESYKEIEKLNDNDFLENMKSIQYNLTNNYHYLLDFIQSGPYQVCIMGHSCGTSDRTLLNTIFEHENDISLKVYYQQINETEDNYIDIVKNISRNFNNKVRMRDLIVNKSFCQPLVSLDEQKKFLEKEG